MSDTPEETVTITGKPITEEIQQIFGSIHPQPVVGLTTDERLTGGMTGVLVTYACGLQLLFIPHVSVEMPEDDAIVVSVH